MNPSKQKGTRAETRVVRYLNEHGVKARRQALSGNADCGDVYLEGKDIILEIKAGKQTANPNRTQLVDWLNQAVVEGENCGCEGVLVVVRHGRALTDADVYIPHGPFEKQVGHMWLDQYCRYLE